jgi:hypothetical protein
VRRFLCVTSVDAIGTGLMLPMSALYFTRGVGLSAISVGLGLSIAGVIGLAATPLTGPLVERFSARGVLVGCYVNSAIVYAVYPLIHAYAAFVAAVSAAAVANRITQPSRVAFVRALAGSNETSVGLLATVATVRNAGFAVGGLLTTVALAAGRREGYVALALANAVSYLAAACGLRGLGSPAGKAPKVSSGHVYGKLLREHRDYLMLAALNAVLLLYDSVLVVGVPLWLTRYTRASVALAGLLFTLNTVLVVGLQIRVSRSTADTGRAARAYARSGAVAATACLLFAAAGGAAVELAIMLLVLGGISLTFGELWASAAEWGASIALAPEANRSYFLSVFGTGTAAQMAFGPGLVSFALAWGGRAGWLLLGTLMLAAGLGAKRVTGARARALKHPAGQALSRSAT